MSYLPLEAVVYGALVIIIFSALDAQIDCAGLLQWQNLAGSTSVGNKKASLLGGTQVLLQVSGLWVTHGAFS